MGSLYVIARVKDTYQSAVVKLLKRGINLSRNKLILPGIGLR
jgi:hypothetical protein